MKRVFLLGVLSLMFLTNQASADIIASTSFENDSIGDQYVDTGDASMDHDLVNNVGQAVVDSDNGVGDLSFDASYVNTRGDVGLTDGDFVGVTDFTGTVGAFTDGAQGYQISDADGQMNVDFGAVNIAGEGDVQASLDYFIADTGFESTDILRIFIDVDGTETDLVSLSNEQLEGMGSWVALSQTVNGNSAFFGIEFDSNSGAEAIFLDNIVFQNAIPEPGSLVILAGMGLVGLIRRRR